jgi:transposase-like protein
MAAKYKRRDPDFKMMVALEAIKDEKQIKEIAREYKIHPKQVTEWRDRVLKSSSQIFTTKNIPLGKTEEKEERLLKKIGEQAVELDFLKKKLKS